MPGETRFYYSGISHPADGCSFCSFLGYVKFRVVFTDPPVSVLPTTGANEVGAVFDAR